MSYGHRPVLNMINQAHIAYVSRKMTLHPKSFRLRGTHPHLQSPKSTSMFSPCSASLYHSCEQNTPSY